MDKLLQLKNMIIKDYEENKDDPKKVIGYTLVLEMIAQIQMEDVNEALNGRR